MDFLYIIFTFLATSLILITIAFSLLILKIFIGKSIRSPKHSPVVGTVFGQLFYFSTLHDYLADIARKHHTFRLLAPDQSELYTTDVRNIEYILKTNFDNYTKGQYNKDVITDLFGHGIFAVDGVKWKQQRKLASFEFSTRVLRDFSCAVFRTNAVKLVRIVSQFAMVNKVLDIHNLLMRSGLDSIFKVGFGVDLDSLDGSNEEGNSFIDAFDDSNALTYWRYVDPFWKLKRFLNIGSEASLRKNIKLINEFVLKLISRRREQIETQQHHNHKEDILSRFLIESEKDSNMDDQYLMDIILNFILAGKDSSANTLSWFFYMLCKNPAIQDKVVSEIKEHIGYQGNGDNVEDFVERINDEVLEKMHYLHAALSETLRLYPAVPVDGRVAESNDILPDGYKLEKGDGVYYISYAMGRMSYIWGDDAEDFKPERWLNDIGVFQPESPFKFVAFHAGPRICLGKDFSYRQMKIMTIALLQFFRFKLSDERKKVTYRTMFTLHVDGGLHLLAFPRT
ncbi:hypothetical protein L1887_22880 [Cichorium endivia]|nr:hypothetical protein L1887_22880 [Cichorium endivia]